MPGPRRLEEIARAALGSYGVDEDAELVLLNISENATFRVGHRVSGMDARSNAAAADYAVLRIHRPGYHSRVAIESELAWQAALRDDAVVRTATVLPALDGERVVEASHPDGEVRHAVMFEWLPGSEPAEATLVEDFAELGAIAARMHRHARAWERPAWFSRLTWDYEGSIGDGGHWGRWQDGLGVGPAESEQLGRLDKRLRERLANFGTGADRFGLIHADMRLANLIVDGPAVSVIDFDDCGFGWYLYDLGSSLSFIEHHPQVPEMIDSWVRGYRSEAPLSAEEEAELETFVLLRRLLLVAWVGSHSDTDLAQDMGEEFTRVSCDLAEGYLARFS